ncbi:MAG TPA: N-acetyltransferase [Bryobacteraceae bacterium]|nr:N-acetyltransferase [Bryobacteraceae bacterium]
MRAAETEIRKASLRDLPALLELINSYAEQQIMLPRTEFELAENIRDFVVARRGGELAACGALHFYSPASGEIRSLAVLPALKGNGLGRRVVEALEREARENGLASLFAFTYVPDFFRKLGFEEVDRGELPLKAWKDCLRCPKFQACDEIAMLKYLAGESGISHIQVRGRQTIDAELIQLPHIKTPKPALR